MGLQLSQPNKTVTWIGIVGELTLALFKGSVGYLSNSKALLADALYSVTEVLSCLTDKIRWKKSAKDVNHRNMIIRTVIMALFSIVVMLVGIQIAVTAIVNLSIDNLRSPKSYSVVAICVSFVLREVIYQLQTRLSKKNDQIEHKVHHVNLRLGLYTSFIVFVGVFLSVTGDMYSWPGLIYLDSLSAIMVSFIVLKNGYNLLVNSIVGKYPHDTLPVENEDKFMDTISRVHGIITVDELKSHVEGQSIHLNVKVTVNPRTTILEAQDITERVRKLLMARFLVVSEVNIQVNPYDPGYPYKSNHEILDHNRPTLLQ
ncbi:cation diffusion facilitator family transporter [Paenibacillus sp. CMAA1364]